MRGCYSRKRRFRGPAKADRATRMEPDEIEVASKSGMNVRNDKNAVIDYDEDRVRLELVVSGD